MLHGGLAGKLILFALPLAFSSILQQLFNSADVAVVGRFAGDTALAAVGSCVALVGIFVNLIVGLSVWPNAVLALLIGQNNREEINRTLHTVITFGAALGVGLMIVGWLTAKPILVLSGTPESVLDQALLRPGRFDRRITIDRPNLAGRIATLEVHTRNIKLGEDVDLKKVALATAGCVGADLANIVNEAALRAGRKGRKLVTQEDMLAAFEFVIAGSEKKNSVLTEFEKKLVAYHEVGHAMVAYRQKNAEPVQKITIVPHTEGSLGYTLLMPEEDKTNLRTRDELMAKIAVSMGGRAAEEVIMHTMTNGASQDIQEATNIARNMVAMYGMSDEFGMMALGSVRSQYLDGGYGLDCAQETAAVMDKAVKEILEKCYADAVKVIEENIDDMHKVVAYLLEKETITGGEMVAILEGRDPATVEDAYASTRRSDSDFRPSVPSTIEAPARHISMTSEKIEMPPLGGEAPDESAASDAENGKDAETPAEETPAQDAPAGDGAETPDHE